MRALRSKTIDLTLAGTVASYLKSSADPVNDIPAYLQTITPATGMQPGVIATAATAVLPQFSHLVANAMGSNAPTESAAYVASIFLHSLITNATTTKIPGVTALAGIADTRYGASGRPAAVAAITAGLISGIAKNISLTPVEKTAALQTAVRQTIAAVANTSYNDVQTTSNFGQSSGLTATGFALKKATGVAGAVTGFVAQLVSPTSYQSTFDANLAAALTAAANAPGITTAAQIYAIAQAAGQAYGWISGHMNAADAAATTSNAPSKIRDAIFAGSVLAPTGNVLNAVNFGFNKAALNVPGAGAAGLALAQGWTYYSQNQSETGSPVSPIFSL